jgi:hypothetical protein
MSEDSTTAGAAATSAAEILASRGIRVGEFLLLVLQLGLLLLLIRDFEIVSPAFLKLAVLASAGFVISYFLPLRHRLVFFLALSVAGIGLVFEMTEGAWLIGLGLALIGICHLPIRFSARVTILILAGVALGFLRANWLSVPWSGALWPILGSMFMFRLMMYLYDLSHERGPVSLPWTLSYFFMLPNVCFPLFPLIDYKTFRLTYYDTEPHRIYQTGLFWMFRGITHLLAYRLVYHYLSLGPGDVTNTGGLIQYFISAYLLLLRVSGHFHLVTGMLHLFGFNLPPTQHLYYLASGFTDLWRRNNIYWKDFMLKVFYYPAYFAARRRPARTRIVFATVVVFVASWLLHSYQWFWIRGAFLFAWNDVAFWAILGGLVLANSLYEASHGKALALKKGSWTPRAALSLSLRTVGTFAAMCVLFSLLSSASLTEWLGLWSVVGDLSASSWMLLPAFVIAAVSIGREKGREPARSATPDERKSSLSQRMIVIIGASAILCLAANPGGFLVLPRKTLEAIDLLRKERLSARDEALIERGYYENLLSVDRFNNQLWERYSPSAKPADWESLRAINALRQTDDVRRYELKPLLELPYKGGTLRTNRWGMRDKDYEVTKPPHTFRIALLGSSYEMGTGVENHQIFESLLEERLNRQVKGGAYRAYEILNFAVGGYWLLDQLAVLENKIVPFNPDVVLVAARAWDFRRMIQRLSHKGMREGGSPYPYLREILSKAGVDGEMPPAAALRRLVPFAGEVVFKSFVYFAEECRRQGITPVLLLVPLTTESGYGEDSAQLSQLAAQAGFTVLDLTDAYDGYDSSRIIVAPWDTHPSVLGHRLLAERLYKALKENEALSTLLALGSSTPR